MKLSARLAFFSFSDFILFVMKELEEEHHKKALQLLESKTKVTESEFMAIKERNEQHLQKMLDRKAR